MASNTQWSDKETHGHKVSYAISLFNETLWIKRSSLILMFYFFSTPFQQFLSWQKRNTHTKESFFSRPCICFHSGIQSCHACSDLAWYWEVLPTSQLLSLLCCYCMTSDLHLTFHPARCQRRGRRISLQEGIKTKDQPFLVITMDISLWFMPLPANSLISTFVQMQDDLWLLSNFRTGPYCHDAQLRENGCVHGYS